MIELVCLIKRSVQYSGNAACVGRNLAWQVPMHTRTKSSCAHDIMCWWKDWSILSNLEVLSVTAATLLGSGGCVETDYAKYRQRLQMTGMNNTNNGEHMWGKRWKNGNRVMLNAIMSKNVQEWTHIESGWWTIHLLHDFNKWGFMSPHISELTIEDECLAQDQQALNEQCRDNPKGVKGKFNWVSSCVLTVHHWPTKTQSSRTCR